MTPPRTWRVWDLLIRLLHWSTVLLCALNWFVLEEGSRPHRLVGYTVGGLLLLRLLWGFAGSHYARFGQWFPSPARLRHFFRRLRDGHHPYYLGHNPVGALMILALMTLLGSTVLTGWMTGWDGVADEDWLEELHGTLANSLLALAGLHAAAVLLIDRLTRSDLLRAMVTGSKRVAPDTQVEDPR